MMQQWCQCPRCGTPVAFGTRFCGNCGMQLNWPTQQQQGYYRHVEQTPQPRKTSPLLIGIVALVAIVLLVVGGVFVFSRFSQGTPPTNPSASTPPAQPTSQPPTKQLVLEDMLVRLDELPSGWYQAFFEDYGGQYILDGLRIGFRNKKYATPAEEISLANNVLLCEEEQAAIYLIAQAKLRFPDLEALALGDDGFYGEQMDSICEIQFIKGQYLVQLEYYGQPLSNVSSEEKLAFLDELAKKVEARIPAVSPP